MISIVLWRRPDHNWPIVLACTGTGETAPGRHWDDRPEILGLKDGSLALNESGVVAAILPTGIPGKRPVSELVLDALNFSDARDAAEALRDLDPAAYQPFTLLVADNRDAYVISRWDEQRVQVDEIAPGLLQLGQLLNFPAEPEPEKPGWTQWLAVTLSDGALVALPSIAQFGTPPLWQWASRGVSYKIS